MEKFKIIASRKNDLTFTLVFLPNVFSVNSILNSIDFNNFIDGTKLQVDLIAFTGDRKERFIEFKVVNGSVDKQTIIVGKGDKETIENTKVVYSQLPKGYINKIYPISYRKEIIDYKNNIL